MSLSCDELSEQWEDFRDAIESQLIMCVTELKQEYTDGSTTLPASCPFGFHPALVDDDFGERDMNGVVNTGIRYTSSIFPTEASSAALQQMFDINGQFDRASGSQVVRGTYDTQYGSFNEYQVDVALSTDMLLAIASAVVTCLAILAHTRSPWITLIGLLQNSNLVLHGILLLQLDISPRVLSIFEFHGTVRGVCSGIG